MWWNIALGSSMLVSSISSMINTISNITSRNNSYQNSNYSSASNSYINQDHTFLRLSKYPSKSTIGYGLM